MYSFDSYWLLDWGCSGADDGCVYQMSDDDMVGECVVVVVENTGAGVGGCNDGCVCACGLPDR